jgi:proline iminopeptidase
MRVRVNGISIFFEVIGTKYALDGPRMREKPTLVLLHGGPGVNDHSAYRPMFEPLAEEAQLVLIDHRGNGRSDYGPIERWNLAQWGDDLFAFCEALDLEKPIVLGNSFGGMVAMSYATRHPAHPGKLVMSSTMARGSRHYFDASVAMFERLGGKEVGDLARQFHTGALTAELMSDWTTKAFPVYTQSPSQLTNPDAQSRVVVSVDVVRHFATGEMRTFDLLDDLAKLQCPTMVMAGELDPICPIEAADDIASKVPKHLLTYRRYANCGHGAYRDVPEAFEELRRFVVT